MTTIGFLVDPSASVGVTVTLNGETYFCPPGVLIPARWHTNGINGFTHQTASGTATLYYFPLAVTA